MTLSKVLQSPLALWHAPNLIGEKWIEGISIYLIYDGVFFRISNPSKELTRNINAGRPPDHRIGGLHNDLVLAAEHVVAVHRLHVQIGIHWQVYEVGFGSQLFLLDSVLTARRIRTTTVVYRTYKDIVGSACNKVKTRTIPHN